MLYSPDRLVRASLLELIADVLQKRKQHLFIGKGEGRDQGRKHIFCELPMLNHSFLSTDSLAINVMGETFWSLFRPPSEDHDEDQRTKLR